MESGIYRIRNLQTDDCYYGSSKNIKKRFSRHIKELKSGKHINIILTRAWEKYGEDSFVFEIVEICEVEKLKQIEQKYLDAAPKYNIGLSACGGDNITNNPKKDLIIDKIVKSTIERYSKMSNEEKREKHSKPLEKNPNWKGGKSFMEYYCDCGNTKKKKSKTCSDCRDRCGNNNPFFSKSHTSETKLLLSKKRKGTYFGEQNFPIVIDDIEYESLGKASQVLGIPTTTIRWRILSKNPKYKNYLYKNKIKISYSEEEQSERLSKSQVGKKHSHNKPFKIDGVEYRTLKEASEILGIHQMTIKGRLNSNNFENYEYIS